MKAREEEDFRIWDNAWSSLPADQVMQFTRSAPRNLFQFVHRCYADDLWPLIERSRGAGRYVEMGSGRGTTSMYLADRGCDVTLVDYSQTALEVARANFAREGLPRPRAVVADVRETGLPADYYDCVYSMGLLEHFDDPRPVLDEMLRVLKPGGYLYAMVVPQRPAQVRLLAYALFAPWRAAALLAPAGLRRATKRILGLGKPGEPVVVRSEFGCDDYARMLGPGRATEVACCPYNPYHSVYNSRLLEGRILVPLYRLHHAIRRRGRPPYARTPPGLAGCLLLTCRKVQGPGAGGQEPGTGARAVNGSSERFTVS